MKTNNFYNLIKLAAISSYVYPTDVIKNKYPVYTMNGTQVPLLDSNASPSTASIARTLAKFGFQYIETSNSGPELSSKGVLPSTDSSTANGKKIFILGSGTSSESANDVALSNRLKADSISCLITNNAEDEVNSSLITITNITNAQIAINEIGLCTRASHNSASTVSDANAETYYILIERRVLQSPITIEPSESVTLIIKTGLEEDLEATVVTP